MDLTSLIAPADKNERMRILAELRRQIKAIEEEGSPTQSPQLSPHALHVDTSPQPPEQHPEPWSDPQGVQLQPALSPQPPQQDTESGGNPQVVQLEPTLIAEPFEEFPDVVYHSILMSLVNPNVDEADTDWIFNKKELISKTSQRLVHSQQFEDWIVSPASRELFVQGDSKQGDAHYVSGLSHFCATLVQLLKNRDTYLPLVFFCGRHVEDDDLPGPRAMIESLLDQCSRKRDFDEALLYREVDFEHAERGDIWQQCALFERKVRQLPQGLTLVCIIDGIVHFETPGYEADVLEILKCILGIARDKSLATVIKVLVTSPVATEKAHLEFEDDDSMNLSAAELLQTK